MGFIFFRTLTWQFFSQQFNLLSKLQHLLIQSTDQYTYNEQNLDVIYLYLKKQSMHIICLFLMVTVVLGQQGGGGYTSYTSNVDSGGSNKCQGDQNLCTAQTAISIVSSFVGLLCASVVVFKYCKVHHKYRNCSCHEYSKLKRKLNIVQPGALTIEQFNTKSDEIIEIMSKIKNVSYMQAGQAYRMIVDKCKVIKRQDYLHEIKMKGKDCNGEWTSYGYILAKSGAMFLWFYKFYDKRAQAGQTEEWKHLLYQSTKIDSGLIAGKWYYLGLEDNDLYCGTWKFVAQPLFINLFAENVNTKLTSIT